MLRDTKPRRAKTLLIAMATALLADGAAIGCIEPGTCPESLTGTAPAESHPASPAPIGVLVVGRDARPGFSPRGDDHVRGTIRVEANIDHVWDVLSGLESWAGLFKDVVSARLERTTDGALMLHQIVSGLGQSMRYSSVAEVEAEHRRLSLVMTTDRPSDFDDMVGRWQLEPLPDGSTLIELRVRGKSGFPVPGFVQRRIVAQSVRRSLTAVAEAAQTRRDESVSAGSAGLLPD